MGSALGNQSSGGFYSVNKDRNDGYPSTCMLDLFWFMLKIRICSAQSGNLQVYCAISRSCNYSAQCRDSENAQCNLKIAQILRLRGTYIHTRRKLYRYILNLSGYG